MSHVIRGALLIVAYLTLCILPLVLALVPEAPPGRGFWMELSVALGFVGLAMLGLQFAITARFRTLAAPYGMDIVLRFHREISIVAFAFVLAHPMIIFVSRPELRWLFNPFDTTLRALLGIGAVVLLVVTVATSLLRERLHLSYERWRVLHGLLAVTILGLALGHVQLVNHYVALPWKQVLWVPLTASFVLVLVWGRIVKPIRMRRRPWRIKRVQQEGDDVWTLVLEPEGHDGIAFQAGQFAWLTVGDTPFTPTEHPFSFSGSSHDAPRLQFTIKELGDFTRSVGELRPGEPAYVDGPHGMFTIDRHQAEGFVLLAGGIGITPMMSMLRTLADRDDRRPILLVYANNLLEEVIWKDELDELGERLTGLRVVHLPAEPPDDWQGPSGFVDADLLDSLLDQSRERLQYFVCGPPPMMDAVEAALDELGIPAGQVMTERFDLV
jgi:predicted ferric reductase